MDAISTEDILRQEGQLLAQKQAIRCADLESFVKEL